MDAAPGQKSHLNVISITISKVVRIAVPGEHHNGARRTLPCIRMRRKIPADSMCMFSRDLAEFGSSISVFSILGKLPNGK